jgi:hypothetical protein
MAIFPCKIIPSTAYPFLPVVHRQVALAQNEFGALFNSLLSPG